MYCNTFKLQTTNSSFTLCFMQGYNLCLTTVKCSASLRLLADRQTLHYVTVPDLMLNSNTRSFPNFKTQLSLNFIIKWWRVSNQKHFSWIDIDMVGHSEILESYVQGTKFVYTMLLQYSFQCSHVTFLWRCPNFLDQITILPKHASYLSLTLTSSIQQRSLLFSEKFYALYFCYCRTFPSLLELGL